MSSQAQPAHLYRPERDLVVVATAVLAALEARKGFASAAGSTASTADFFTFTTSTETERVGTHLRSGTGFLAADTDGLHLSGSYHLLGNLRLGGLGGRHFENRILRNRKIGEVNCLVALGLKRI